MSLQEKQGFKRGTRKNIKLNVKSNKIVTRGLGYRKVNSRSRFETSSQSDHVLMISQDVSLKFKKINKLIQSHKKIVDDVEKGDRRDY